MRSERLSFFVVGNHKAHLKKVAVRTDDLSVTVTVVHGTEKHNSDSDR